MIFASKGDAEARIRRRCVNSGHISLFRSADYLPSVPDMIRLINSYAPELAFIEVYDRDEALKTMKALHEAFPTVAFLGFADVWLHEPVLKTNGCDLRVIPTTLTLEAFKESVLNAVKAATVPAPDNVLVFVPAKAGNGASTVALNVAGALANKCGTSTILIEADLHSGPAGMYLNLNSTHSVVDALEESHRLDSVWTKWAIPLQDLTILPAYNIRGAIPQPPPWAYRRLISFAKQRYEHVIFDLPEVVNSATEVIVNSAQFVYVVCTPEVPSLILARKRFTELLERGVPADRLKIVLNRFSKHGPKPAAIEEILGLPIERLIPNDYKSLWEANLEKRLVADNCILAREFEHFACSLSGKAGLNIKAGRKLFGLFPAA
jgi:pilus assembly protein CpaE